MKVLFLDIDGVLNSTRTAIAYKRYPFNFDGDMHMFDEVAIRLIQKLCEETSAVVCVSSTWRGHFTDQEISEGLSIPVVGHTPLLYKNRGYEIQEWLDKHPDVTEWAIVDDNSDMLESQKDHFVQTDGREGLSYKNFCMLRDILNGKLGGYQHNALFWEDQS